MEAKISFTQNFFFKEIKFSTQNCHISGGTQEKFSFVTLGFRLRNNLDSVFWSMSHESLQDNHISSCLMREGGGLSFCVSCLQPVCGGVGVHT